MARTQVNQTVSVEFPKLERAKELLTLQNIALWRQMEDERMRRECFNQAVINECWVLNPADLMD